MTSPDLPRSPAARLPAQSPLRAVVTPSQLPAPNTPALFSPLDGAGFYEADRIVKSGQIQKRKKRTKTWGAVHLVLRPTTLSIYKDEEETQLRHQIKLSDVTAIAIRKDKRGREWHTGLFDLYTAARNFHFEAESTEHAREWIDQIRKGAKINELEEGEVVQTNARPRAGSRAIPAMATIPETSLPRNISSSPETRSYILPAPLDQHLSDQDLPAPPRLSEVLDHSATDPGSFSDFSDEPMFGSVGDLPKSIRPRAHSAISSSSSIPTFQDQTAGEPATSPRKLFYMLEGVPEDERVICHGFLRCLKTHGVRQWKKYWVVLRGKSLALYKDEEEYRALLLLPMSTIIDAVEIDAISSRRKWCFQVIGDRNYKFAAASEDDLSKWLGSVKAGLAKKSAV